jgi:hypothetical protein
LNHQAALAGYGTLQIIHFLLQTNKKAEAEC